MTHIYFFSRKLVEPRNLERWEMSSLPKDNIHTGSFPLDFYDFLMGSVFGSLLDFYYQVISKVYGASKDCESAINIRSLCASSNLLGPGWVMGGCNLTCLHIAIGCSFLELYIGFFQVSKHFYQLELWFPVQTSWQWQQTCFDCRVDLPPP